MDDIIREKIKLKRRTNMNNRIYKYIHVNYYESASKCKGFNTFSKVLLKYKMKLK